MSTKIYNGYRIKTGNIKTVIELLDAVGKAYDIEAAKHATEVVVEQCSIFWDRATLIEPAEIPKGIFYTVLKNIQKAYNETRITKVSDPFNDFEFSVVVFPREEDTLAQLFATKRYTHCLTDLALVEDYSYWNNVEWPEDITKEAWDDRGRDWDATVGYDAPNRRGLTRECSSGTVPWPEAPDVIAGIAKSRADRAEYVAKQQLIREYPPNLNDPGFYYRLTEWFKEDDRLAKRIAEVLPKLTDPTYQDLIRS